MLKKDMLLIEAFRMEGANIEAMVQALAGFNMHCLGCSLSHGETIEQAAQAHNVDPDMVLDALNKAAALKA